MDWLGHESHGFPHQNVLQDKKKFILGERK